MTLNVLVNSCDLVLQESGFEVVYDDAVLRSYLLRPEASMFEPRLFQVSILLRTVLYIL